MCSLQIGQSLSAHPLSSSDSISHSSSEISQLLIQSSFVQALQKDLPMGLESVSLDRQKSILDKIAVFEGGKTLLQMISDYSEKRGHKIAFIQYDQLKQNEFEQYLPDELKNYAFQSEVSGGKNAGILFVLVPPGGHEVTEMQISVCQLDKSGGVVRKDLLLKDGSSPFEQKTIEGYTMCHELSHVLKFMKVFETTCQKWNATIVEKAEEIKSNLREEDDVLRDDLPIAKDTGLSPECLEYLQKEYDSYVFQRTEAHLQIWPFPKPDLRNDFIEYIKSNPFPRFIITEWDSYKNDWNSLKDTVGTHDPLREKLLSLGHEALQKLFETAEEARNLLGIDGHGEYFVLRELRGDNEDCVRAPYNEESEEALALIPPPLASLLDFPFEDVNVRGDGNCGIWAVLQALNPGESFTGGVSQEQQATMRGLRTAAAREARDAGNEQARIRLATEGMEGSLMPEDFQYISALPRVDGRPIVIVQHGIGRVPTVEIYRNGEREISPDPTHNIDGTIEQMAMALPETPPIILHFNPPPVGTKMVGHYTVIEPRDSFERILFGRQITQDRPSFMDPEYANIQPS